jgi:RND family efflux transporter MFP subunit
MGQTLLFARIFAAVLMSAALSACGGDASEAGRAPEGPVVQVVAIAASGAGGVRASGLVGYRREPPLSFTSPGVIGAIYVDAGDSVRRGQRLATLRRISVGANAGEAELAQQNAERDLARAQALFDEGFVSQARLEDARLAVERARGASVLVAPSDGIILRRAAEPSQTVAAGQAILVLGETASRLVVRAPTSSSQAARVRVGDAATLTVSELGQQLTGRVTRVGAQGDQATGAFEIEIEIVNPQGLRSGMVAAVEIAAAADPSAETALLAPTLSLLDARADQGVVFVVDAQNIARRRSVRTAGVTQDGVLVVEGLQPGERIVSAGAAYVRDGEPVRIAP